MVRNLFLKAQPSPHPQARTPFSVAVTSTGTPYFNPPLPSHYPIKAQNQLQNQLQIPFPPQPLPCPCSEPFPAPLPSHFHPQHLTLFSFRTGVVSFSCPDRWQGLLPARFPVQSLGQTCPGTSGFGTITLSRPSSVPASYAGPEPGQSHVHRRTGYRYRRRREQKKTGRGVLGGTSAN